MTGGGASVLVSWAGRAEGSRAAAAALACAGADPDRAGLMIDLADGRAPRPALIASVGARRLEERLAAHLPEAGVAARGHACHLVLPTGAADLDRINAALALVPHATGVVHLPPSQLRAALERSEPTAIVLRADLDRDRALCALAARDLMRRKGLRVAVLKRPLAWLPARRALFGVLPAEASDGLPARLLSLVA